MREIGLRLCSLGTSHCRTQNRFTSMLGVQGSYHIWIPTKTNTFQLLQNLESEGLSGG